MSENASSQDPSSEGGEPPTGDEPTGEPRPGKKPKAPRRTRRPLWLASLVALITFLAVFGTYMRERSDQQALDDPAAPAGLFRADQAAGTPLTSVGRIMGTDEPCTAWLLDTGDPEGPALVVTTARCVGVVDTAAVVTGQPATGAVEFNAFARLSSAEAPHEMSVPIAEVVWASARWTDLAVLRLDTDLPTLVAAGIGPIAGVGAPASGTRVLVAGIPRGEIPADQQYLRGTRCLVGATTDVLEAGLVWQDMLADDCAGFLTGSAGSVAFDPEGHAVGMLTTSTTGSTGTVDCASGRPCEVDPSGAAPRPRPDTNYAVSVDGVGACFTDGRFVASAECRLEDPATAVRASTSAPAGRPGASIAVEVGGSPDQIGWVAGRLGLVDCHDPAGWAKARVDRDGSVDVTLPAGEGWALICVGSPDQPTPMVVQVDATAPDPAAVAITQTEVDGGVQVEPTLDPPDVAAVRWTIGPDGTDCATAEGFLDYTGQPATVQVADLPATLCVIAIDEAGNASAPRSVPVA